MSLTLFSQIIVYGDVLKCIASELTSVCFACFRKFNTNVLRQTDNREKCNPKHNWDTETFCEWHHPACWPPSKDDK